VIRTCPFCGFVRPAYANGIETAQVTSNVRAYTQKRFGLWRCPRCGSIHAEEPVDLAAYYQDYPYLRQVIGPFELLLAGEYVRRLLRAGLRPDHSVLDYGCGVGLMLEALRRRGFRQLVGYDKYNAPYQDTRVLHGEYDCVNAQDVLEHDDDPIGMIACLTALTRPGGLLVIATPNAAHIDLSDPEQERHPLHQPYHRHILSYDVLCALAAGHNLELVGEYHTRYNTPIPFSNLRYMRHYVRFFDDTLDLAFEPLRLHPRMLTPRSLWLAFLGFLDPPLTEMHLLFRRRG